MQGIKIENIDWLQEIIRIFWKGPKITVNFWIIRRPFNPAKIILYRYASTLIIVYFKSLEYYKWEHIGFQEEKNILGRETYDIA